MPPLKWEYAVAGVDLQTETCVGTDQPMMELLAAYGQDSWELVGVVPKTDGRFALLYFKRFMATPHV
jgi:hypothetical protein